MIHLMTVVHATMTRIRIISLITIAPLTTIRTTLSFLNNMIYEEVGYLSIISKVLPAPLFISAKLPEIVTTSSSN